MRGFSIERRIGIDMGHRVPTHGSKCWNLHGHRYEILAEACSTQLHEEGEQQDMVVDFGFLKEAMMTFIDGYHDHGFTMWCNDPWVSRINPGLNPMNTLMDEGPTAYVFLGGHKATDQTKMMIVPFIPTAERLAEFWYHRLLGPVDLLSKRRAKLLKLTVYETPNCSAIYPREYS